MSSYVKLVGNPYNRAGYCLCGAPCSKLALTKQVEAYNNTVHIWMQTKKCTGMTIWDFKDKSVRTMALVRLVSTMMTEVHVLNT
ncbi:hypothetical protein ASPWEDRAFT_36904 [Aspergillus wentii DTO 134E9]|uniref:Uncharacterized protein n=1 Tax=Aspergillus wentii DTO 134E9 TaxID=1073089 RepID=A0A1L9RW71_ASPWE|nr:uncharacterized protein ASPWEDRAFT_36904 [Aspergillus wentii DTO 134E9]OJJ39176.1 hypothetical protein ASPWEDRAFT_36904 [Aspergillus wentii DTO 134E9]